MKKFLLSFLFIFGFLILNNNFVFAGPMDQLVGPGGTMQSDVAKTVVAKDLSQSTVPNIISNGIKIALGFFGAIALFFVIWGGIDWMMSKGEPAKIKAARDRMTAAAIGLFIVATSYAIADFVISQISVIAG